MTAKEFQEELIIAGFGGQGVILIGKLLTYTSMKEGYEVTYMPSYGAEVRGGTANCMVVIAREPVACPLVSSPNALIVMNKASMIKFTPNLQSGGLLVFNRSLIEEEPERDDIEIMAVPADEIAESINSPKSANMVALGAYLQKRGFVEPEKAVACLPDILARRYHQTIPLNAQAIRRGAEFAQEK